VLWPPGTYKDHPTPPSISLEEGKRDGETWSNTRITLTLDKAPNVIQNLQIAYAKALEIPVSDGKQTVEPETEVAKRELAKPSDPIKYLKNSILETMATNTVYPRYKIIELMKQKHQWPDDLEIEQAFSQLLEEGKARPKFDNLNLVGFTKS